MALHGVLKGGGALGGLRAVDKHVEEVLDNAAVAAAVTFKVGRQRLKINDLLGIAEDPHPDDVGLHVGFDLALGAHGLEIAVAVLSEGAHGELDGGAVLHQEVGLLVVHNVVVAVVHAAPIGTVPQGIIGRLNSVIHAEHRAYPVSAVHEAGLFAGDIYLLRVENALVLDLTAAQAVFGGALRSALLLEQVYAANGRYRPALFAHKPGEYVHVMAGLLQDHGAGLVRIAPVATHEGVGLVPVAHVLVGADGDDLADLPAADNILQRIVEVGVPQDVAEDDVLVGVPF